MRINQKPLSDPFQIQSKYLLSVNQSLFLHEIHGAISNKSIAIGEGKYKGRKQNM
jgi:hypothetical protein